MQAVANETEENKTLEIMGETAPLFSSDEIIFPDESVDRPYTRYGYKISDMNFLVPEGTASEILQNQNVFMLPNSPAWIEGLINIRGNIIPVMNMDKFIKNSTKEKLTNILVLDKSDNTSAIAILISDLPVSLEHNDSKTSTKNYPDVLHDFINEGFSQNDADWIEFDPQELFKKLAGKVDI